ncbi:MAG: TonB-dependent receptor [Alphaproteobacteria bacterium]|nr:TonB-dependent receptor [Alphaproteobacteria bacterium]
MQKLSFTLFAATALATGALAAETPETIVVTATRTSQPLEVTGTSLSIVTAQDLQTQQISMATDALAELPGVTVVRNGGVGQTADVLMRGAEAGQTLVVIDGVRINDPSATSGIALLGDVLVNGIDRIEVLRGPQSTLYGSDAIGGVINIMTTRGGDSPYAVRAEAEGGSFDTYHVNAAANGTVGSVQYGAAADYYGTNSVSAADSRNGNREADGYHHLGLTGNVRWLASDAVSVDARIYYTRARDSFDGYPPPNYTFQDTHEFGRNTLVAAYGGVNLSLLDDRFRSRFAVTRTDTDRLTFDPSSSPEETFFARGGATRLEYQGIFEADSANEVTFGAESETTTLVTQSIYDSAPTSGSDRINGFYAQWQSTPTNGLTVTGGVRYDDDREFKGHTSVKLAAAWQVLEATTLRANYGDGFKAPSLYELFSQYSNPVAALKPETARGWEAGIDQGLLDGRLMASLTYFERRTNDQIDFFSCYGVTSPACSLRAAEGGYYYNVDRSRATGAEATLAARVTDALTVSANYTNLTDIDLATGLQLARRPRDSANVTLTWRPEADATLGFSVDYIGTRYDDAGHFTPLRAATHANLFASYKVTEEIELFGRIENVLNDGAEPVAGYGTPGRAFYAGVRTSL